MFGRGMGMGSPSSSSSAFSADSLNSFGKGILDISGGDNITRVNNFKVGYTEVYNYYNFSDRVDYNITDKWKLYGRIGKYYTDDLAPDATPNHSKLYVPTGTSRGARSPRPYRHDVQPRAYR